MDKRMIKSNDYCSQRGFLDFCNNLLIIRSFDIIKDLYNISFIELYFHQSVSARIHTHTK